jgi:uncharacterized membrane protein (DUF4010 family)
VSVTGVVAALAVFALGGLAVLGDYRAAAAGGVALAGVLASREPLHRLLGRISWIELRSVLLLAGMTAIVLPLLPNRTIDPWAASIHGRSGSSPRLRPPSPMAATLPSAFSERGRVF